MKYDELNKFKADKEILNATRIIMNSLLSGGKVEIGDYTYVAAETTDGSPFKICIVAEDDTILGTGFTLEGLYDLASKVSKDQLFLLSTAQAMKSMVPERILPSEKEEVVPPRINSIIAFTNVDISKDELLKKIILATKLDMEAAPDLENENQEMISSLENILEKEELSILNISHLYPYIDAFIEEPTKYDEMYVHAVIAFGEEKAKTIVSDIKEEHAYMHSILSEHFTINSSPEGPCVISKKEISNNNEPTQSMK